MLLILINRNKKSLKRQINFLIQQEFRLIYESYGKILLYLIGATLAVLAISFLTDIDSLVVFKGVTLVVTALAWVVAIIFAVTQLIKFLKRTYWRDKAINSFLLADTNAYLAFDQEKLSFITDTYKSDINWEHYKYYAEDKSSVFLLPEQNLYEALYFSDSDIGAENFEKLKAIVTAKLLPMGKRNGT